ncbi:hypothetical protein E1A91_A12G011300v1 [Gossypium mustelinum]|uniref:Desiccation-related protein PCC13-62-like n=2 Tax=Gossypium TaxID=3633 RepID=A0A5D2WNM5_GOSMU|nr:hypothetical protein E1A91_A12G011300v1 [Gossypium mustelinum]
MASRPCLYAFLLLLAFQSTMIKVNTVSLPPPECRPEVASTKEKFEFLLNLLIFKIELFLRSSIGRGINDISPGLVQGPIPIGAAVANLDNATRKIIEEFGLASIGHLRVIINTSLLNAPIPMPLLDISPQTYNTFVTMILNGTKKSNPSYNPYANTNSFLFAAVFASSFLKQYYAGIMPSIIGKDERELLSGIALYEAGVFGALRAELNARVNLTVPPFNFTVGNLTNLSAQLANRLAGCGVKDEGLIVPLQLGAENRTSSNIVPGNANSLAYARSAREILRIVFTTGNATRSGGIFPRGLNGALYRRILTLKLS